MHPTQRKILELGQRYDLRTLGLREIGRHIDEPHPQKVKYHMIKLGLLSAAEPEQKEEKPAAPGIVSIPILGLANCGEATIIAEAQPEGHLHVSNKYIGRTSSDGLFAVQAVGNSMNRANVGGSAIEDGDYVVVDAENKDFRNGDYVLSMFNNLANIKKFTKDEATKQIILVSESSEHYAPIYIHEDDLGYYMTSGKVITVLKRPRQEETTGTSSDNAVL